MLQKNSLEPIRLKGNHMTSLRWTLGLLFAFSVVAAEAEEFGPMSETLRPEDAKPEQSQRPSEPESKPEPPSYEQQRDRILERMKQAARMRPAGRFEKRHESIIAAFRDVVTKARESTVRILSDEQPVALGTIVDDRGFILTKASELGERIEVQFAKGFILPAELWASEQEHDLALLKINGRGFSPVAWAADTPAVGSWLASAGVEEEPVAIGVLSVPARELPQRFRRSSFLGIGLDESKIGPRISQVFPGSAAAKAKLKLNDVILSINGKLAKSRAIVVDSIRLLKPGEKITLLVNRDGKELELDATLGSPVKSRADKMNSMSNPLSERRTGFPSVFQHDSVLWPENCGGPILNLDGEAVGINIARTGRVDSYAIPFDVLLPLIEKLKKSGLPSNQLAGE